MFKCNILYFAKYFTKYSKSKQKHPSSVNLKKKILQRTPAVKFAFSKVAGFLDKTYTNTIMEKT